MFHDYALKTIFLGVMKKLFEVIPTQNLWHCMPDRDKKIHMVENRLFRIVTLTVKSPTIIWYTTGASRDGQPVS